MIRVISLLLMLVIFALFGLAGCAPRYALTERPGARLPASATVTPGQSLILRLEDGSTAAVTAGKSYVSALGEACVRVTGHHYLSAACLRGGEWIGLPDIFIAQPIEEAGQ